MAIRSARLCAVEVGPDKEEEVFHIHGSVSAKVTGYAAEGVNSAGIGADEEMTVCRGQR